jgi:hypothetical protein
MKQLNNQTTELQFGSKAAKNYFTFNAFLRIHLKNTLFTEQKY